MATRAEKVAARLPHFYLSWDRSSVVSNVVESVGKRMEETENDLMWIMRSHWVDTASGKDLDMLGALFSIPRGEERDRDYRGRLKTAIISYKGGGTVGSIKIMARIALGMPSDHPIEVRENPPVARKKTWKVRANGEWTVDPRSIKDSAPEITITVNTEGASIVNPTLLNVDTGEAVTYNGRLSYGDSLKLSNGQALLNGRDETQKLSDTKLFSLPRRKTKWRYTESIGSNIAVFDQAHFDKSVFAVDITSSITFEWTAYQPASFEVLIPKALLERSGARPEYVQRLVDSVKACGVKGEVKVISQ
jgi:hypothetical protein